MNFYCQNNFAQLLNNKHTHIVKKEETLKQEGTPINLQRIPYETIKEFLFNNSLTSLVGFQNFKAQCYEPSQSASFHTHLKTTVINAPLEQVWKAYQSISPQQAWSGDLLTLGLLYDGQSNRVFYVDEKMPTARADQIFIVRLQLLGGVFKMAVAHKVMEVNAEKKLLRLCYLEGGKARGSQFIRFEAQGEQATLMTHETKYDSHSQFRDRMVYPFFHGLFINAFHDNVIQQLNNFSL